MKFADWKDSAELIGIVAIVALLVGIYWFIGNGVRPAARILDENVPWEPLAIENNPAEAFALIVDEMIAGELARRLDIDTSEEAARRYMQQVSPELFAADRVRNDQEVAGKLADALEMVLVQGVPEDEIYETLSLAEFMTVARWEEFVMASTADQIPTLRTFAAAPAPMGGPDVTEQIIRAYMTRAIREKLCALPGPYSNIRARLLKKVAGDATDPLLRNVSVFEAECAIEQADYIRQLIDEVVIVYREELGGYSRYLTVLDDPA